MIVCEKCGRRAVPKSRFCAECGAPLQRSAPELKHVTVVVADLCGSTGEISRRSAESGASFLQEAVQLMGEAVESFGGTVSQVRGDGLLALFGAPLAQEDHAVRACLAALAMHERLQAASLSSERPTTLRIGIDSGEVLVGFVTEFYSSYYRPDGPVVHIADRLQKMATPATALISGATEQLISGRVTTREVLRGEGLRGISIPVKTFEITLGEAHSAVAPLARRREMAPMVGRSEHLAKFDRMAEKVRAGQLQVVGLKGDAGIGKSRLAAAVRDRLRARGFADHWVSARAYSDEFREQLRSGMAAEPHALIADLVRALLKQPQGEDGSGGSRAVSDAIDSWAGRGSPHRDAFADLLELGGIDEGWRALMPGQRRDRLVDALQALLMDRLAHGPVLLVIDDLYRTDRDSQELLFDSLLPRLANTSMLICATYRPDYKYKPSCVSWLSELQVGPLAQEDMTRIAVPLIGTDPSMGEVIDLLLKRAEGNPFFLEQLTMTLVDDGTLEGSPGDYRCKRTPTIRATGRVKDLICPRVDRLPALSKEALECAAILGDSITLPMLCAMLGRKVGAVASQLNHVLSAGLLRATADKTRFVFPHALVPEAILESMHSSRAKQLHRTAFNALCPPKGQQPTEGAASVLFRHAYSGEAWPEAVEYARLAVKRSIAKSANSDAERVFGLGLHAAAMPGTDPSVVARLELKLRLEVLGAQMALGHTDRAVENLARAREITRLSRGEGEAFVTQQLAVILWAQGMYLEGLEAAASAESAALRTDKRHIQMAAHQARMMLRHGLGRYAEAAQDAREVLKEFSAELRKPPLLMTGWAVIALVNVHAFLADSLGHLGEFEAAQLACNTAKRELANEDHALSRVLVDFVQGSLWLAAGCHADAARLLGESLRSCEAGDVPTMRPPILARYCTALAMTGQPEVAISMLQNAIANGEPAKGGRYNDWYFPISLAESFAQAGRSAEALEMAMTARKVAKQLRQRGHEAHTLYLLAALHTQCERDEEARSFGAEALEAARECSMRHLEAKIVTLVPRASKAGSELQP